MSLRCTLRQANRDTYPSFFFASLTCGISLKIDHSRIFLFDKCDRSTSLSLRFGRRLVRRFFCNLGKATDFSDASNHNVQLRDPVGPQVQNQSCRHFCYMLLEQVGYFYGTLVQANPFCLSVIKSALSSLCMILNSFQWMKSVRSHILMLDPRGKL
jgi:hypothetical protein